MYNHNTVECAQSLRFVDGTFYADVTMPDDAQYPYSFEGITEYEALTIIPNDDGSYSYWYHTTFAADAVQSAANDLIAPVGSNFSADWIREDAFALTIDRQEKNLVATIYYEHLAESYPFDGTLLYWQMALYSTTDGGIDAWVGMGEAMNGEDFRLDGLVYRGNQTPTINTAFDYDAKTFTVTMEPYEDDPLYMSDEKYSLKLTVNFSGEYASDYESKEIIIVEP